MKKLRLHLDDLLVDGFRTAPVENRKGTVFADEATYVDYGTCGYSCAPTCYGSCPPGTCYRTCRVEMTCYMAAC